MAQYRPEALPSTESERKTYDRVFNSIKQYIVECGLKPGDRLPREVDLCKALGVSRNTMREALKSLQKLGIIEAKQKEGMVIREFNFDPILENMEYSLMVNNQRLVDLINLRITLELAYLEEAVQRTTYEQIGRMHKIVDRMERKARSGVSLLQEDMAFHLEMYSQVDNGLAQDLIQLFWKLLIKIQNQAHVNFDPTPQDTVALHRRILEQFAAHDLENCRQTLFSHYHVRDRLQMFAMNLQPRAKAAGGERPAPALERIMQVQEAETPPALQSRIYDYLRENGQASHRQLSAALSGDPSLMNLTAVQVSRKLSNTLQNMRREGVISAVGEKSGAVWKLRESGR